MKKGKSVLSFVLAAVAAVGIFAGVKLGSPKADAANKTPSEFFTATKNAQLIPGYQLPEEMGGYKGLFVKAPDNGDSTVTLSHELDLRAFTKEDALLSVIPVPTKRIEEAKDLQIHYLTVRMTDVENEDIFVEMKVQRNPDDDYPYAGYAQGRGSGQVMTGINYDKSATQPTYYANGNYGRKVDANFYARGREMQPITSEIQPYKFAYDYETSSVHTLSARDGMKTTLVADLLDSSRMSGIFKGFTSGKVTLSITATSNSFNNKDAGFLIVDFAGLDFTGTQAEWVDVEVPFLTVDTKGYEETNLPKAELFRPYPIYSAVAFDKFDAACGGAVAEKTVEIVVKKAGGEAVQIKDGYFTPTETGIYEISYVAVDNSGNKAEKIFKIQTENPQNIEFSWDEELISECTVGEKVAVPTGKASGVYGNYEMDVVVSFEGKEIAIENGAFLPERAGTYEICVNIDDFLGRTATFIYYVEATAKQEPILVSAPSLPAAFFVEKTISLPDFNAYDYYSIAGEKLEAEKYYLIYELVREEVEGEQVQSEGALIKKVLPDETFVIDENFIGEVIVKYVAKSFLYEAEISGSKVITIIDNREMDFENSFVYENCYIIKETVVDEETGEEKEVNTNISGELGIAFAFTSEQAVIHFAGEMIFYGLDLSFRVPEEANKYARIVLTVTDAKIFSRQVVFMIEKKKDSETSKFYVNGKHVGEIVGNFEDTLIEDFRLKINTRGEIIDERGNLVYTMETYSTGEKFEGFSDNLCYISFGFEGVEGSSALQITKINNQTIDPEDKIDYQGPIIQLTNSFDYEQNVGDIVLPGALAVDFVRGRTEVSVEIVMNSTGETIYTGKVTLNEFVVSLKKSGEYTVTYYADDGEEMSTIDKILHVYDLQPFSVTLNGEVVESAKLNDTITLPSFTVDSRLSSADVIVYVVCPKGGLIDVTESLSFTADQKGVYKVYYYVVYEMENSYSYDLQVFDVEVK